ncbi:MAG: hypothetical protein ACKVZH_13960 [Blastocatellia bacterium]
MKKFSFLLALSLLASAFAFSPAKAQTPEEKQAEFERGWYDSCQVKKDDKCLTLCEELLQKYPSSSYAKFAKQKIETHKLNMAWEKFQKALQTYYAAPDATKLEQLFTAGDEFNQIEPDAKNPYHLFVSAQLALAGHRAALTEVYKNFDKVKGYAERGLSEMAAATGTPEKFKTEYPTMVDALRDLVAANVNQFLAFRIIQSKNGTDEEAIGFLTKASQVKGKDGDGWKDPNNYWLRANIYFNQYIALSKKYNALTDDEKKADVGKAVLKDINQLIETYLIPDYARAMAAASKPEAKELREEAKKQFDQLWKYRTDAPEKAAEFLKAFEADPTVAAPPIPVKVETPDSDPAALTPTASTGGNVKLSSGSSAPGTGAKPAANGSNGTKATTTKGKAAPKATPKKKGRR